MKKPVNGASVDLRAAGWKEIASPAVSTYKPVHVGV